MVGKPMMNNKEILEEVIQETTDKSYESLVKRQEYIRENTMKWLGEGEKYRDKRMELGLSLR